MTLYIIENDISLYVACEFKDVSPSFMLVIAPLLGLLPVSVTAARNSVLCADVCRCVVFSMCTCKFFVCILVCIFRDDTPDTLMSYIIGKLVKKEWHLSIYSIYFVTAV
jgi:hypothetical protein